MHLRHVIPFLILFAWQAAPTGTPADGPSNVRLSLGGGSIIFSYGYWGLSSGEGFCNGCNCVSGESTPEVQEGSYETDGGGAQLDGWTSPDLRVSAAAGLSGPSQGRKPYAAALVAWEGRLAGFGAGWAAPADRVGYRGPAAYARIGPLDGLHLRADLRTPTTTPGVTGWAHAGLAYNQGRRSGMTVFLGVSAVEAGPDTIYQVVPALPATRTRPAAFVDVSFPVRQDVNVIARGHITERASGYGFGLAVRLPQ